MYVRCAVGPWLANSLRSNVISNNPPGPAAALAANAVCFRPSASGLCLLPSCLYTHVALSALFNGVAMIDW